MYGDINSHRTVTNSYANLIIYGLYLDRTKAVARQRPRTLALEMRMSSQGDRKRAKLRGSIRSNQQHYFFFIWCLCVWFLNFCQLIDSPQSATHTKLRVRSINLLHTPWFFPLRDWGGYLCAGVWAIYVSHAAMFRYSAFYLACQRLSLKRPMQRIHGIDHEAESFYFGLFVIGWMCWLARLKKTQLMW